MTKNVKRVHSFNADKIIKNNRGKKLLILDNSFFEIKDDSMMSKIIDRSEGIKKDNKEFKENPLKRRKKFIKNKNNLISIYITVALIILRAIIIFSLIKCNILIDLFHFQYESSIKLKIKGIGYGAILGTDEDNEFSGLDYLEEVHINGNKKDIVESEYYFNQEYNLVELIWDDNINDCQNMFAKCKEIIEIDLSNFKTSHVTNMYNMFRDCYSLTSLNLSNLDTSHVEVMHWIFYGCSSLTSLDLSNFDTTSVANTDYMFSNCDKLKFINLNNFKETNLTVYNNTFYNIPDNVVICLKEINNLVKIPSLLDDDKKCDKRLNR